MRKDIFTKSEGFREEYSCAICRVGEVTPIEGSDFLAQTVVSGFNIVVRKDEVHEGDVVLYAKNETALNKQYLSANNAFEIGEYDLNSNAAEVASLIENGQKDEAKKKTGFFNKHGRVKMIKLRGCPSMGYIFTLESLVRWDDTLADVNLEEYIDKTKEGVEIPYNFDTVNGKLFAKAYVPKTNMPRNGGGSGKKTDKTKKFDRLIEGEFSYHYDTQQLNNNMWKLSPDNVVDISLKVHGTSGIFGNILVKSPTLMNKVRDLVNSLKDRKIRKINRDIEKLSKLIESYEGALEVSKGEVAAMHKADISIMREEISDLERKATKIENSKWNNFSTEYYNIYSSRKVIKNRYINKQVNSGYYSVDVWGEYHRLLEGKIPENVTIYGEIVGYENDIDKMIQKGYDYGCERGKNKLMIYRVNEKMSDGTHKEYEISEVIDFANKLVEKYPEISDNIMPYPLLYHGKLTDLYPDIDTTNHWHENVLAELKADKEHFGMELDEPLCKTKVPREGICLRIENDPIKECFKLKSLKFLKKESDDVSNGIVDIEMADNYGDDN